MLLLESTDELEAMDEVVRVTHPGPRALGAREQALLNVVADRSRRHARPSAYVFQGPFQGVVVVHSVNYDSAT